MLLAKKLSWVGYVCDVPLRTGLVSLRRGLQIQFSDILGTFIDTMQVCFLSIYGTRPAALLCALWVEVYGLAYASATTSLSVCLWSVSSTVCPPFSTAGQQFCGLARAAAGGEVQGSRPPSSQQNGPRDLLCKSQLFLDGWTEGGGWRVTEVNRQPLGFNLP